MTEAEQRDDPLDPQLRAMIAELDAWLPAQDDDDVVEHVLPFATEWILRDVDGLDVDRLTEEAKTFVLATPMADRVLLRYKDDVAYWLGIRMFVDEEHRPDPERGRVTLASA